MEWFIPIELEDFGGTPMFGNTQMVSNVFHLVSKATCRAFQPPRPPKFMARTAESKVNQPQRGIFQDTEDNKTHLVGGVNPSEKY